MSSVPIAEPASDAADSAVKVRRFNKCVGCGAGIVQRAGKVRCAPCASDHYAEEKRRRYREGKKA